MSDIILDILNSLSLETRQEISSLTKPIVGDSVFCYRRKEKGLHGGGQIIEIDSGDIVVAWWDPADGGYRKDVSIFEADDFTHFKDGKSGRLWYRS